MGNNVSQKELYQPNYKLNQLGAGYTNNIDEVQTRIEQLVKSKKSNFTDTMNFENSSDLDFDADSISDQMGGKWGHTNSNSNHLTVKSRRARYLKFVQNGNIPTSNKQSGGNLNSHSELSPIGETDFRMLKNLLEKHQSASSNLAFSPTSDSVGQTGGGHKCAKCNHSFNQTGGCGCTASPDTRPENMVQFKSLVGGKSKKNKKSKKQRGGKTELKNGQDEEKEEDEDESDIDAELDEEEEDAEDEELEEEDEDEDDTDVDNFDEGSNGDELALHDSSSVNNNKSTKKIAREYADTDTDSDDEDEDDDDDDDEDPDDEDDEDLDELSGGKQNKYSLNKKYVYSDNGNINDNGEWYRHVKNRNKIR